MQIKGDQLLSGPPEVVYEQLMDPEILAKAIPGCKALNKVAENKYQGELELGVAAIKGHYVGEVEIRDPQPPNRYVMAVSGQGGPGFVNAELNFTLTPHGNDTSLYYEGEAQVGGKIAGVGQRMLGGVAKMIAKQFFSAMSKAIAAQEKTQ
ncbi:MAG: carbon monoxide dehydrogenase subunit G [Firmicutes bacterium]|nr:carbon monoxide dehydrogenase subunit G [Bacillota bacterium]